MPHHRRPLVVLCAIAALAALGAASAGVPAAAAAPPPDPSTAPRADFRALEHPQVVNPEANLAPLNVPAQYVTPRLLLAGDSWAQYMWDDGSHNDIFDRFGFQDRTAVSISLGSDPGPGYTGNAYAVSGSEARQWVDTANFPYIANMVAALQASPTIDRVLLSIGGNDVLAGKSDGGWYMGLDVPGSEAALFDSIHAHTETIIGAALAVRPDIRVILSSYDYPNFNTGVLTCWIYACPERQNLSRDPVNALITDAELNGMMVTVEGNRIAWTNADPRADYDDGVGLMHYWYGDGTNPPLTLPKPGQVPPDYLPFPGGNPARPTLRSNFRNSADPIHLNVAGYQYKIAAETDALFLPLFRGDAAQTFFSRGGSEDGWTDGVTTGTAGIRLGDNGTTRLWGLVSFDTSNLPDDATVTHARLFLTRKAATGTDPFTSGALGTPTVDVATGTFGGAAVETGDATAPATAAAAGYVAGSAKANGYALGVELDGAGLAAINLQGLTQFRISFPMTGSSSGVDDVTMSGGNDTAPPSGFPTLAAYMGTSAPFLDVSYSLPVGIGEDQARLARMLPASPNPFRASTSVRFDLRERTAVRLRVIDVRGRRVATLLDGEYLDAGGHAVAWNGKDDAGRPVAPGVYVVTLEAGALRAAGRLVRLD
jgi:hypothetical protein